MSPKNRQSEFRRPESVLVVVFSPADSAEKSPQVLLLERVSPTAFWQSVTGTLEAGETPEECARRELLEETGIAAEPANSGLVNRFTIMPQWQDRYAPGTKTNTEYVFSVSLERPCQPVLNPQEHLSYCWLDAQTASHWCFSVTNAQAIQQLVLKQEKKSEAKHFTGI